MKSFFFLEINRSWSLLAPINSTQVDSNTFQQIFRTRFPTAPTPNRPSATSPSEAAAACVGYRRRKRNERRYVKVTTSSRKGCSALVGVNKSYQVHCLNLAKPCWVNYNDFPHILFAKFDLQKSFRTILHEILHSYGFLHAHQAKKAKKIILFKGS